MTYVDWKIRVQRLATCSCDYGCPCEFGAQPTQRPCEGVEACEIVDGHYADVPLNGLRVAGVYRWPGPVHEGQGTYQVDGFEFREAEMASRTFRSSGPIEQTHAACYGYVTVVTYGPYGIVDEESCPRTE